MGSAETAMMPFGLYWGFEGAMVKSGKPLCRTGSDKWWRLGESLGYCAEQGQSSDVPLGNLKGVEEGS